MTTNGIQVFAGGGTIAAGDVMSPEAYAADSHTSIGHQAGIARRELENTALRQVSRFCRGVAQFIAEGYAPGVVDDGDTVKIVDGLWAAINEIVAAHNTSTESHPDIRALIEELSGARYETLYIGAGAMIPSATNGAEADTEELANYLVTDDVLTFPATADASAEFSCKLPETWDRGSVRVKLHWAPASGATAERYVGWQVAAGATGNGDTLDRGLGAAVTVADQVLAGLNAVEHITGPSAAIPVSGSPALGDRLHFKVTRDYDYAGSGTALAVAARLLGVEIQYRVIGSAEVWS